MTILILAMTAVTGAAVLSFLQCRGPCMAMPLIQTISAGACFRFSALASSLLRPRQSSPIARIRIWIHMDPQHTASLHPSTIPHRFRAPTYLLSTACHPFPGTISSILPRGRSSDRTRTTRSWVHSVKAMRPWQASTWAPAPCNCQADPATFR